MNTTRWCFCTLQLRQAENPGRIEVWVDYEKRVKMYKHSDNYSSRFLACQFDNVNIREPCPGLKHVLMENKFISWCNVL